MIPEKEIELKRWWDITGSSPHNDTTEIIVGSTIQIQNTVLSVVGFLTETGSNDDYSIFLSLRTTQILLNNIEKVSVIDVEALCKDCPVEVISQQIMDALPHVKATPVKQAVERERAMLLASNQRSIGIPSIAFQALETLLCIVTEIHSTRIIALNPLTVCDCALAIAITRPPIM